jgi:GNAT superfamily N-acetyltransferase
MLGDVSIRFVTRADYAKWLPLWDGYNAFYERTGPTALDPAITAMTWARFFDAYEPVHALVAERDGELLGLFTSQAARGKGVGRALINGVYEQAKLAGSPRVYWFTFNTNHTAMQLYDKVAEKTGIVVYRKLI